jgi:uncharacterized protein
MKKLILFLSVLVLAGSLFASKEEPIIPKPNPQMLVTDYANMLSADERAQLERKLVDFNAATSNQIAVVTITDLKDNQISDFAFRLGQDWGIGNEKFDNGILILVKPKTSEGKGEVFIAVGYGLEGAVPDATTKQIVENEIIPRFQNNDIFGGIEGATNVLMAITQGEYNYKQYAKKVGGGFNPFIILIILFVLFSVIFRGKRGSSYTAGSHNSSLPFWIGMGLLSGVGNRHSGLFNDFSSGSGSFGGGSSFGDFGGFGGGGFGGGGAGGSW